MILFKMNVTVILKLTFTFVTVCFFTLSSATTSQWNWLRARADEKLRTRQNKPAGAVFQLEIDRYLEEPNVPMPVLQHLGDSRDGKAAALTTSVQATSIRADSLRWWSIHSKDFPNLSRLARTYLAIPATSVSSERMFSKAGLIISERRSRLAPDKLEKIAFLSQNWMDWTLKAHAVHAYMC